MSEEGGDYVVFNPSGPDPVRLPIDASQSKIDFMPGEFAEWCRRLPPGTPDGCVVPETMAEELRWIGSQHHHTSEIRRTWAGYSWHFRLIFWLPFHWSFYWLKYRAAHQWRSRWDSLRFAWSHTRALIWNWCEDR